jgi:hypothetical protein
MEHGGAKSIEADGISEEFFNLLWTKDELNFGPSINIPDTVIFKYGQPVTWYFTASNGKIKKKNRNNLLNARIEDAFTKNTLGYDVVATFISMGKTTPGQTEQETTGAVANTIEYMDRKDFQKFLYDRWESNNGILQRFVEPKGTKNETIRAIWSPKVCLLERAENIHQLHDHRYGLYERCVTFEGPEFYCTSAPLRGPVLAGQVQRVCEAVVSHISEVTFAQSQVSRIVLNLKVDSRDKVWLLYTTSIRCALPPASFGMESVPNPSLLNIESVLTLPPTVHLNPSKSYDKIKPKQEIRCISCGTVCLEDLRHPMQYKTIIKHYEHVLHLVAEMADPGVQLRWPPNDEIIEAAGGVGFGCLNMAASDDLGKPRKMDLTKPLETDELRIPPVLRYVHPKLSAKSFQQCRKDPLFLYKTLTICENCYLVYAEFTTMLLRVGQDLTKLFAVNDGSVYERSMSPSRAGGNLHRPSSADWRAMSSVNAESKGRSGRGRGNQGENAVRGQSSVAWSSHLEPSGNHITAKENAIGLRSSSAMEQPSIPSVVRNERESIELLTSKRQLDGGMNSLSTNSLPLARPMHIKGGRSGVDTMDDLAPVPRGGTSAQQAAVSQSYSQEDIRRMVADRERLFFKEISKNPQLKDQHPLMHLISSQQKLAIADEMSGVLTTKSSMNSESLFGSSYGKLSDDRYDKYGVYKNKVNAGVSQRGAATGGNASTKKGSSSKRGGTNEIKHTHGRTQGKPRSSLDGGHSVVSYASSSTATSAGNTEVDVAAQRHKDFLKESLNMVRDMDKQNSEANGQTEKAGVSAAELKQKKAKRIPPVSDASAAKSKTPGAGTGAGAGVSSGKKAPPVVVNKKTSVSAGSSAAKKKPAAGVTDSTSDDKPSTAPSSTMPPPLVSTVPRPSSPHDIAVATSARALSAGMNLATRTSTANTLHRSGMIINGEHFLTQLVEDAMGVHLHAFPVDGSDEHTVHLNEEQVKELRTMSDSKSVFVRKLLEESDFVGGED